MRVIRVLFNTTFSKGHHLLIALLLFFQVSTTVAMKPLRLDSLNIQQVWFASQFLPGSGQVINKQYWKIPVFYTGMGTMLYLGVNANKNYHKVLDEYNSTMYGTDNRHRFEPSFGEVEGIIKVPIGIGERERFEQKWTAYRIQRNIFFTTAGAFYVASIADALIVNSKANHSPTTATLLSAMVPGMGQVYNQKLWKVPIIYGAIATLYYMVDYNDRGYQRFRRAYEQFTDPHQVDEFGGTRSKEFLLYYRNAYRRNRDLTIISLAGLYLLNIIDANVDAHFFDWDISDNLALRIEPVFDRSVYSYTSSSNSVFGVRLKYDF